MIALNVVVSMLSSRLLLTPSTTYSPRPSSCTSLQLEQSPNISLGNFFYTLIALVPDIWSTSARFFSVKLTFPYPFSSYTRNKRLDLVARYKIDVTVRCA
jgi:hypothetical protein